MGEKKKKKGKAGNLEILLGIPSWVYVWSITEMRVHWKTCRSVQVTLLTRKSSIASADALEKGLTSRVSSRVPRSSSL